MPEYPAWPDRAPEMPEPAMLGSPAELMPMGWLLTVIFPLQATASSTAHRLNWRISITEPC